jgi:hypothetical protein
VVLVVAINFGNEAQSENETRKRAKALAESGAAKPLSEDSQSRES